MHSTINACFDFQILSLSVSDTYTNMFKMASLLVLLCMSLVIVKGEGSHCMATTSGAQHGLSLYLRVCCVNSNLGQGVHMRENNSNKYILCPSVRPRSCPPGKLYCVLYVLL